MEFIPKSRFPQELAMRVLEMQGKKYDSAFDSAKVGMEGLGGVLGESMKKKETLRKEDTASTAAKAREAFESTESGKEQSAVKKLSMIKGYVDGLLEVKDEFKGKSLDSDFYENPEKYLKQAPTGRYGGGGGYKGADSSPIGPAGLQFLKDDIMGYLENANPDNEQVKKSIAALRTLTEETTIGQSKQLRPYTFTYWKEQQIKAQTPIVGQKPVREQVDILQKVATNVNPALTKNPKGRSNSNIIPAGTVIESTVTPGVTKTIPKGSTYTIEDLKAKGWKIKE